MTAPFITVVLIGICHLSKWADSMLPTPYPIPAQIFFGDPQNADSHVKFTVGSESALEAGSIGIASPVSWFGPNKDALRLIGRRRNLLYAGSNY
jgi:hypothetical protein